jgi:hypothetical protein
MAQPAAKTPLDEALASLRRDPTHPVRVHMEGMDVELRAVATPQPEMPIGDYLASLGPWEGENTEELLKLLHEGRRAGGSEEPPRGL